MINSTYVIRSSVYMIHLAALPRN